MTSTRDDDTVRRQAADWLARLRGEADADDRAAFEAWRSADPAHAETFDRMTRTLDRTAFLAGSAVGRSRDLGSIARRDGANRAAVAAGIGIVALIGIGVAVLPDRSRSPAAEPVAIASTAGASRTVKLDDGTIVALSRSSRIRVDRSGGARRLTLDHGRARFFVAKDAGRAVEVVAASVSVVAVASVFDLAREGPDVRVAVLEGSVGIRGSDRKDNHRWTVGSGEQLVIDPKGQAKRATEPAGDRVDTAMLEFDGLSVADAVMAINRTSHLRIQLADGAIASRRITGAFRAGDAAGFAEAVTAIFALSPSIRSGNTIRLGHALGVEK